MLLLEHENGEYFEITNRGELEVDLLGMVILDDDFDSHPITQSVPVDPGQYVVLARNGNVATNGGFVADYVYDDFLLGNGDDEVVLAWNLNGDLAEADRVAYDDLDFPDTPGRSMELTELEADNGEGSFWADAVSQYGDGDFGTPGFSNSTAVNVDFVRGDASGDEMIDIADAIRTLDFLFSAGPDPSCPDAYDANDDGNIDVGDAIFTLGFLFSNGPPPPPPHPNPGPDPTADPLECQ